MSEERTDESAIDEEEDEDAEDDEIAEAEDEKSTKLKTRKSI